MTERLAIEKPQELPMQDQPQPEPHPEPQPAAVGAQLEPKPAPAPAVGNVSEIVQQLKQERERAQKEVQTFDAAITALGSNGSNAQPLQPNPQSSPNKTATCSYSRSAATTEPASCASGGEPSATQPAICPRCSAAWSSKTKTCACRCQAAPLDGPSNHGCVGCRSDSRCGRIWRLETILLRSSATSEHRPAQWSNRR